MLSLKYLLAGTGLFLAVLDFFGLDDVVEDFLRRFRSQLKIIGYNLSDGYRKNRFTFAFLLLPAIGAIFFAFSELAYLVGAAPTAPTLTKPDDPSFLLWLRYAQFIVVLPLAVSVVLWFLWYPLDLMTRTPRGIVGSLGLILAIVGFWF